jgi:hypothetical protein
MFFNIIVMQGLAAGGSPMCIPYRLVSLGLGVALTGCGGSLTLPDDGSPAALRVVSGDGQEAPVGRRLEDPLVVKLTGANSQPISGVPVVFQFKGDVPDAEVDPAETETDSAGRASAEVRVGTSTGSHEVEARVASSTALSATFVVTALERNRGKDDGGSGDDDDD